jgi:hypothetical protein
LSDLRAQLFQALFLQSVVIVGIFFTLMRMFGK